MRDLTRNIRFWILLAASVLAIGIGIHYGLGTEFPNYGKLVRTFALLAVGTLYLTLLITPLYDCFPKLPYRGLVVKARRAMGVSVVMFSTLHLYFAFYKQLGGWVGLPYLEQRYVVAITVAAIASCILWLMALTSFDSMVRKLGPLWKRLHRLVYTAGFLIIFHALSIGTHFVDLRSAPARIMLLLVFALFVLEALRLDRRVRPKGTRIGIFTLGTVAVTGYTLAAYAGTPVNGVSVHTQHSANTFVMPGMQKNDMSTRYTVNIVSNPVKPVPGQPVAMTITFYNAITGQKVSKFTQAYEKFLHMVVVNNGLTSFEHLHPATTAEGSFELTHTFKEEGTYRMYFNFHPFQAPEQIVGQTVVVGTPSSQPVAEALTADIAQSRTVDAYTVSLSGTDNLRTADASAGTQPITFSVFKGAEPASLAPYLGAFGHLTMINTDTYEFVHAHPAVTTPPKPEDRSGPDVSFIPMGLYAPLKPGTYRIFGEFAPDGTYIVVPFTVKVQ